MRNAKYEIKPPTGVCGDRTEPGIFYDGNDLAWRNGVLSTLGLDLCWSVGMFGVIAWRDEEHTLNSGVWVIFRS